MFLIKPHNIETYSRCPKRAQFSWNSNPTLDFEAIVLSNIIKAIYLYESRRGRPPTWKHIPSWIDKYYKEAMNLMTPLDRYKESKNILSRIYNWYHKHYMGEYSGPGLANVPIRVDLDHHTAFSDTIDIVGIHNKIRLFDIVESDNLDLVTSSQVYNDMSIHARIWGFQQVAQTKPNEYVRIVIGPISIRPYKIHITDATLKKGKKVVKHILEGIRSDIVYPAISEQCIKCPYTEKCSF